MKNKILGLFVILFSFTWSQEVIAQIVVEKDVTTTNDGGTTTEKYAVIDCSGMPKKAIKTGDELKDSKQTVGGRVLRHRQANPKGDEIVHTTNGTDGKGTNMINQKVSRKFAVAPNDIDANGVAQPTGHTATMTWAQAAGWFCGTGEEKPPLKPWEAGANIEITGESEPADTGCAMYRGRSGTDPKGSWRLPTQRELMIIYSLHGQFAKTTTAGFVAFSSSNYWSAAEYYGSNSWYVNFLGGVVTSYNKTNGFRARCVRDL